MIEQQGLVVSLKPGRVWVRLGGTTGCTACDAGTGCGAGVFGKLLKRRPVNLEFEDLLDCRVGQSVIVGLPESLFLRLLSRLYLLPLLAGLAGAVLGHYISVNQGMGDLARDALTLFIAAMAGTGVIFWNRQQMNEFPVEDAVHLLRQINRSSAEACTDPISTGS